MVYATKALTVYTDFPKVHNLQAAVLCLQVIWYRKRLLSIN